MTPPVASSAEPPKRRRTTAKRVTTRPSPSAPAPDPALARDSLESTPKRRRKTTKRAPTGIPSGDAEPTVALGTEPIGDAPEAAIVIPTGRLEIDPTETNWVGGDHGISPSRSDGCDRDAGPTRPRGIGGSTRAELDRSESERRTAGTH